MTTEQEVVLKTIRSWARSCKTIEQLENVKKFFFNNKLLGGRVWLISDWRLYVDVGITVGYITGLEEERFKKLK